MGVVIWLLGLRVPLLLMAIASRIFFVLMKEKATRKSSKTAFQKILNYLLFQDFNTPEFNSGYVNLSESFIESNKPDACIDTELNLKLEIILKVQLLNLNFEERSEIVEYIFNDNTIYFSMLFIFIREIVSKDLDIDYKLEFDEILREYQITNVLNMFVLNYFSKYFSYFYELELIKSDQISEIEYNGILEIMSRNKSFLFDINIDLSLI